VSETGGVNGTDCPAAKKVELTSCYKAKCDDNEIIFSK